MPGKKMFWKMGLTITGILICLASCGIRTYAKDAREEIPDLTRMGSISVEMRSEESGEAVPGGSMTLYLTAYYIWDGSRYIFRHSEDFIDFSEDEYYFSINDLNAEKAEKLAEYAEINEIEGVEQYIGDDGKMIFRNLEAGLYLLAQREAPEGYYCVKPFFVTVPLLDEYSKLYDYDVNATPKTRPYVTAEPAPEPLEPVPEPTESETTEWTLIEPAIPVETEAAETEPTETEPGQLESKPEVATPSEVTPEETEADRGANASNHRGGSGGGKTVNAIQMTESAEITDELLEISTLADTGERLTYVISAMVFVLAGLLLAAVLWVKSKMFK